MQVGIFKKVSMEKWVVMQYLLYPVFVTSVCVCVCVYVCQGLCFWGLLISLWSFGLRSNMDRNRKHISVFVSLLDSQQWCGYHLRYALSKGLHCSPSGPC